MNKQQARRKKHKKAIDGEENENLIDFLVSRALTWLLLNSGWGRRANRKHLERGDDDVSGKKESENEHEKSPLIRNWQGKLINLCSFSIKPAVQCKVITVSTPKFSDIRIFLSHPNPRASICPFLWYFNPSKTTKTGKAPCWKHNGLDEGLEKFSATNRLFYCHKSNFDSNYIDGSV